MRMAPRDWLGLTLLALLWAGSFLFVGVAVRDLPPLTIVLLRVGIAAAALQLFARGRAIAVFKAHWRTFVIMGVLNNALPFFLFVWGQRHIASGLAAILNATTPLFTVVVAHVFADERLTPGRLAGIGFGILGVAFLIGPVALDGLGAAVLAQFACLAAALSYAFAGVFGRRFARLGVAPIHAAAGQTTASALLLLPVAAGLEQFWTVPPPSAASMWAIAGLSLLSTALAYVLYFAILARVGAGNLLLVTFMIPPGAVVLGNLILTEPVLRRQVIGLTVILFGLWFAQNRNK